MRILNYGYSVSRLALIVSLALGVVTIAEPLTSSSAALAQCGKASWYQLTSMTANGERANPNRMTAAHKSLPFNSKVRVINLRNGKSVVVRINDRGPFIKGRVIDLTRIAAAKLGFKNRGWTQVRIEKLNGKPIRRCG